MTAASNRKRSAGNSTPEEPKGLRPVEPVASVDEETATDQSPKPRGPRGPYNVKHVEKKATTLRLPLDALQLIDDARAAAAEEGNRLTKDDAVTQAIRWYYGGKRRRR